MKLVNMTRALLMTLVLICSFFANAQVAVPPLSARVIDQTATLSVAEVANLEHELQMLDAKKGSQLVVLIVPTTQPETIEQYALRVAEKWQLGRKKVDDGVVLLIAKDDRAVRIEVGYGLEGALNDATSKRIISEVMIPLLKKGDFYGSITAGAQQIIRVIDGEALPDASTTTISDIETYVPLIFMLALILGGILRAVLGRFFGSLATGGGMAGLAWLLVGTASTALVTGIVVFLFTLLAGGMAGRSFGGGFGRGGGSGGGFGGGGGGFGGGGASGRW